MMPQSNGSADAGYVLIEGNAKKSALLASFGSRDPVEGFVGAGCLDRRRTRSYARTTLY